MSNMPERLLSLKECEREERIRAQALCEAMTYAGLVTRSNGSVLDLESIAAVANRLYEYISLGSLGERSNKV